MEKIADDDAHRLFQGDMIAPGGEFARPWVQELARLPKACIHQPWRAGDRILAATGVRAGETCRAPIVDHAEARYRALGAYETSK